MERSKWMYEINRASLEYLTELDKFVICAEQYMVQRGDRTILCPCRDCGNMQRFPTVREVRDHLIRRGFRAGYTRWVWHGEGFERSGNAGTSMNVAHDPEPSVDSANDVPDEIRDENVESIDNTQFTEQYNELDEMMNDVEADFVENPEIFENLCRDSKKPLFPGCTKYTKLSGSFKLYNIKAKNGWSDKSFTSLLELLRDMLPEKNELPVSTYRAKKLLCPLSMSVERIHACPNNCILYRNEYKNLEKCPKCEVSRYKPKENQTENEDEINNRKMPAAKVLWYLPIIPRFRRLFANPRDAERLRWHSDCRKEDGMLRHPADSPEWRNIDRNFPIFGGEPRNLRLGLCTDGMNPYGNMSSRHSTWPVLLCVYNLPPWLCMKRKYMMMPLLISGPKQPGNDIDVYLAPLIEDLQKMWSDGVPALDASLKESFTLRAMIFCTINDFPAYSNLSGHRTRGAKACPICGDDTCTLRLKNYKKNVYMGHRRFLRANHPYRQMKKEFNGMVEDRTRPKVLSGKEVYDEVKGINVQFGKKFQDNPECRWKKRSIFCSLPYWSNLSVRHSLDTMHIVKNVCDSLVGLLLNIPGKTKDGINARKDMVEMKIRPELHPREGTGKRVYLPPACYTLSKDEKKSLLQCLSSIKVPTGYSSNISKKVSEKDFKLIGMKSHDCHVLLTQLLPVAIRGILPEGVRHSITKLCFFFNTICSKVIDPEALDDLQRGVVVTLCDLEMYFPPSFFDIMVHLTVHLVREVQACGPAFLRHMYPFERAMGQLKGLVRSRSKPEGSIVEGYVSEEVIEFCTDYMSDVEPIGLPKSRHEGRLLGIGVMGTKHAKVAYEERQKAHLKVIQDLAETAPYVAEHLAELRRQNPSRRSKWVTKEHISNFAIWFQERVKSQTEVSETVKWLANGPNATVYTYKGYDLHGYTWYTKEQDGKSTVQNSGVSVVALSGDDENRLDSYYGWIEEIWELDYFKFRIPLFKCKWIDNRPRLGGVRVDKDTGIKSVDFRRTVYDHDPFILATQAKQVFYIVDPADKNWHVVLPGKRHIVGIGDVVDEEEYDRFDAIPPISVNTEPVVLDDNQGAIYMRTDHQDGLWVE